MYKHLSNFVKILMLMVVLFLSEGDVIANGIPSPEVGRQLTDSKSPTATTPPKTPTQEKGYVDKIVELSAPAGSVLATLFPSTKNCNYVKDTQYQPFSGIDKTFPGAESLGVTEVTDRNGTEEKGKKVTCINVSGGTEGLLKILFTMLISIIIIMSVINISVSGIQYMTEEAIGKISGGARKRLQNSFVALGLGLMSYAILYTVNKQLVAFNFDPSSIDKDGSIDKGKKAAADAAAKQTPFSTAFGSIDALSNTDPANKPDYQPTSTSTFIDTFNNFNNNVQSSGGMKLNDKALNMLGEKTCDIDFTGGGTLACAYVVNNIINKALGKPLTGKTDQTDTFGRSTADMKKDLDSGKMFYFVGTSVGNLLPGDVIISPTVGSNTGHVGIYTNTGKIVSNSSSRTKVDDHFTPTSWLSYYNDKKNLITYIYRISP